MAPAERTRVRGVRVARLRADSVTMTAVQRGRHGKSVVGVLTVIQEEFDAAKAALGANTRFKKTRYWHGDGGTDRFVLAKMPDRSNVPAAEAARDMFEYWRPDVLVLVGISGGLSSGDAGLGDVVVPDYLHYGEFRKLTDASDDLRFAAYDHPNVGLRSDIVEQVAELGDWVERITGDRPALADDERYGSDPDRLKVEVGSLVAGEKIMGDPDHPEQQRMFVSFEHAIAVDMESWGVGRTVQHARTQADYNPRLVIIRGISDIVERPKKSDEQKGDGAADSNVVVHANGLATVNINNEQRKRWKNYAAATAAAFAARVVEDLLDDA